MLRIMKVGPRDPDFQEADVLELEVNADPLPT